MPWPHCAADRGHPIAEELRARAVRQYADAVMRVDVVLREAAAFGERRRVEADACAGREDLERLIGVPHARLHLDREYRLDVDCIGHELLDPARVLIADRRVLWIRLLLLGNDERARLRVRRQDVLHRLRRRIADREDRDDGADADDDAEHRQ